MVEPPKGMGHNMYISPLFWRIWGRTERDWEMRTALVIVAGLALLGLSVGWAIWGWEQTAGTEMSGHGWLALILGIVFTMLVGFGLMGLMFFSSRYGYDERAGDLRDENEPRDPEP